MTREDAAARVIPDDPAHGYLGMYRVLYPDGTVSDMVNLTRAKDAAASWNAGQRVRESERKRGVDAQAANVRKSRARNARKLSA